MAVKRQLVISQPQVSNFIRDLQLLTGLTQEQFAAELSATHSSASRWERGINKPSPLAMQKLEGVLQQMGDRTQDLLVKYFSEQG